MMDHLISEISRRLSTIIETGLIHEVDHERHLARVKIGDNITRFLPLLSTAASIIKSNTPIDIGEQVVLLSPSGDLNRAVILRGIFYNDQPRPEINEITHCHHYPDGALLSYDYETHQLIAKLPDESRCDLTANNVQINCDQMTVTGKVIIEQTLDVEEQITGKDTLDITGKITGNDALAISGKITGNDDAVISGISVTKHKHDKVMGGAAVSGGPL